MYLSEKELEALHLLIEECAEVTQAATKVIRFGWESCAPDTPGVDNYYKLVTELGDLCGAMTVLSANCGVDHNEILAQMHGKLERMRQNGHHYFMIDIP